MLIWIGFFLAGFKFNLKFAYIGTRDLDQLFVDNDSQ